MEERDEAAREVDELAPDEPSLWVTVANLLVIWSTPFVALAIAAWVSTQVV